MDLALFSASREPLALMSEAVSSRDIFKQLRDAAKLSATYLSVRAEIAAPTKTRHGAVSAVEATEVAWRRIGGRGRLGGASTRSRLMVK